MSSLAGRRVLLVSAFDPWAVGNGSSLRARRWCDALAAAVAPGGHLDVVVVPVVHSEARSPYRRLALPTDDDVIAGAPRLLTPRWREWMVRVAPLPAAASRAPAWLGDEVLAGLAAAPDLVVAFKMAVAPAAAHAAMECGVPLVVDLDDDEAALAAGRGDPQGPALERLLRGVGDLATVVTVASPDDLEPVQQRVMAAVHLVPNVVDVPALLPAAPAGTAVYVANFGYRPNQEAATWLRDEVVPGVRGLTRLSVVGAGGDRINWRPPTQAAGRVPDVRPWYAGAAVAVCPVLSGGGTSIKVIEAMAHGRAVITTPVGARGLGLRPGEHAVVAPDAAAFAAAWTRLATDPRAAAVLGERGRAFVSERYSPEVGAASMSAAAGAAVAR